MCSYFVAFQMEMELHKYTNEMHLLTERIQRIIRHSEDICMKGYMYIGTQVELQPQHDNHIKHLDNPADI